MCLASEDICRQIVPLVTHHCVIQKLFFVKTSCYIFSLHDKNQEGWGQKFNRSLELFINRRSALERILDIQVECLQMKFISERQREEKFSHYLSLLVQCTCLLLQEQPLSCASPTTYPRQMAGTIREPHQDFTRQPGFYRESKFALCQTLFFKLLFWKLQFYIKEVCCCQCRSLGI